MSQNQIPASQPNSVQPVTQPDLEVAPRAKRRTYTAAYKLRILQEADLCDQSGQVGALLRREGLYSSHLTTWRRQRAAGQLEALSGKKRGRKARDAEVAALRKENQRLRAQLKQAELIIAAQKKLSQALEQTLTANGNERS
jgi:transposase-like protein